MICVVELHRFRRRLELIIIGLHEAPALHFAKQYLPAKLARSVLLLDAHPLPDLVSRPARAHMLKPVAAGLRGGISDDLDCIRVLELPRQRGLPTIDPRTARMQANLRMHGEREVDRRRTLRQLDDVARRSEHEDLVLIEIELQKLQELVGSFRIELQLEHLPEPVKRAVELVGVLRVLLESPVSSDAVLRGTVHLASADLNLEELLPGSEDRRVQRLVSIRLRLPDVILDALLERRELLVNHAERVITIGNRVHQNADRHEVIDLLIRLVPLRHLLVDRPEVLRPARYLDVRNRRARQELLQRLRE